jgi:PPOX class probable F420-dependent enzyme
VELGEGSEEWPVTEVPEAEPRIRPARVALPEAARELFAKPNFVTVATIDPDGQPQLSVVWAKLDAGDILFSTIKGRRKYSNLIRDGRASALVYPADDPYTYAEVRGSVTITEDPSADLINELSLKYTGKPFGDRPGEQRVIVRIIPDRVVMYLE